MNVRPAFLKPWYLIFLPVFFVFHGFVENFFLVPVADALLLLLIYIGISVALAALFWLYFRNIDKAVLFVFLLMAFNFFFGLCFETLNRFFADTFIIKYSVILSVALLVFVTLAILIKKRTRGLQKLSLYLNLVFSVFIIVDVAILIKKVLTTREEKHFFSDRILPCHKTDLPDVYLVIADEYAGEKDLKEVCGFDNSFFLDSLRKMGFFVANNSRSSYNYTSYSMASLLNMDYLPLSNDQIKTADHKFVFDLIRNNRITSFFRKSGYTVYNYSMFDIKELASKNTSSFIPARTKLFTSQTLFDHLKKDVWLNFARKAGLNSVLKNAVFENLIYNNEIYQSSINNIHSADTARKFVYTHLSLPHYPYYFDSAGNQYSYQQIRSDVPGNIKSYTSYLQYTNRQLLKLVNEIFQHSSSPPVIILMSDHGYRSYPKGGDAYVFVNLFSIYLPNKNYDLFNDSITNVNVFRSLLNSTFCQQLPLKKDTTITIENY